MFRKIIKSTLLNAVLILLAGSLSANVKFNLSDEVLLRDTIHNSSEKIQKQNSETVIRIDESKIAPRNVRIIFNELFRQYISVKDALVYNDSYNFISNTLKLLDDMKTKTKDLELLNKDERWMFFINNFDSIRRKAESTKFISEQRFLFNEITNGLKKFLKQFGLYDKTIYLMKSTADSHSENSEWFSDSRDKKNPYLGLLNDSANIKVLEVWIF